MNAHDSYLSVVNGDNWRCIYSEANVKALRYGFEQGHQYASEWFVQQLRARSMNLMFPKYRSHVVPRQSHNIE